MKRFFSHLPALVDAEASGIWRRIHHHHAARCRRFHIDIVDADAGAAHHLQARCGIQQLARHLGGRADRQPVIVGDDGAQLGRRQAQLEVDIDATVTKDRNGGGRQLVADQHFRHGALLRGV
jgi:hypothetical protein